MQFWRLELGIWKTERKLTLKDWFEFSYDPGLCGCKIFTISRFYITWLGDECYSYWKDPKNRMDQ